MMPAGCEEEGDTVSCDCVRRVKLYLRTLGLCSSDFSVLGSETTYVGDIRGDFGITRPGRFYFKGLCPSNSDAHISSRATVTSVTRRKFDEEAVAPLLGPRGHRCFQAMHDPAPLEEGCTCTPEVLDMGDLAVGSYLQISSSLWSPETALRSFIPAQVGLFLG